jgi:hypothetical protein
MTEALAIDCRPTPDGWTCSVHVGSGRDSTAHQVAVSAAELERLAPGSRDPRALVETSFRFLLEHEPKESILRRFAIGDIGRYFPGYPSEIRRRMGGG